MLINGRDSQVLEACAQELRAATGSHIRTVAADINQIDGQRKLIAACPEPDILVNNNAGPGYPDLNKLSREQIFESLTRNMVVPFELANAVLDGMATRGFGRVVNITSISVKTGIAGLELSGGARAGMTALLSAMGRQYLDRNVTVNHILPGYVETETMRQNMRIAAEKHDRTENDFAAERQNNIPAKRFAQPEEIGQTCAFLCSRHAGYISGQNVLVDGGICNILF